MRQLRILPDLVTDSKLDTNITPEFTEHISYTSGLSARRVTKSERWIRDGPGSLLGSGAYGTVYLEKCGDKVRAVKEIKKHAQAGEELDYFRELEAIMKFSHERVSNSPYPD